MRHFPVRPRGYGMAWRLWAVGLGLLGLGMSAQGADVLRGPIRGGFSVAEADRETGARKYALWGESATPLTADRWEIQSPRLELYGEGDTTNLVFMPSRCVFDQKTQEITSTEPLKVWSGDGYLQMQGEGFSLDLEARRLWVSNRVEAVMDKRLFEAAGGVTGRNVRPGTAGSGAEWIRIQSDRLEYGNDRAEFLDRVGAEDAEGRLECQRLAVDLTPGSSDVRGLRASGEVLFVMGELRVEAAQADYDPVAGQLELEGDPRWVYRQRPGRARKVVLNRDRQALSAAGEVRMELPSESFSVPRLPGGRDLVGRESEGAGVVRVMAERLEVEPRSDGGNGQRVLLQRGVVIEQGTNRLRCEEFRLHTEGDGHALARAEAMGNVVIERGMERLTCELADYDAGGASAAFSGGVDWQGDGRSGAAKRVWLDLAEGRYRADGGVRMRFERGGESWAGWLTPEGSVEEAGEGEEGGGLAGQLASTEVESDRFEYRGAGAAGALQTAAYDGNVVVRQGDRMHMTCGSLLLELGPETNQVQSVVADGKVELRATDGSGYRLARGDRAVYDAGAEEIVLTGREGVDFFVIAANGVSRGVGRQAVYRRRTDTLILAGDPAITTPAGELVGREVRLDRREGVMSATGPWQIRLPLGGLELPRMPGP
jgi:lipopolysaccharide export system protein LptA